MAKNNHLPQHIGIIMDGNRRWAKAKGLNPLHGHRQGIKTLKDISIHCFKIGIKTVTLFAFSTENWQRSKREVTYLMRLFKQVLKEEVDEFVKQGIQLKIIGQTNKLDKHLQASIKEAASKSKTGKQGTLNICFNYGGQEEIISAVKKIIKKKIPLQKITPKLLDKYLWTTGQPNPDLIIRTSGELRLSNFLTWQSIYSELYFCSKNWPVFTIKDMDKAIAEYGKRKRRFGRDK